MIEILIKIIFKKFNIFDLSSKTKFFCGKNPKMYYNTDKKKVILYIEENRF